MKEARPSHPHHQVTPVVHDAIVLAGGRAQRLGDIDKAGLLIGGRRLLDRVLDATLAANATVVVGPPRQLSSRVRQASEEPPNGGIPAAIGAGLRTLARGRTRSPWTLVLACDLPLADRAVVRLLKKSRRDDADVEGYCLVDDAGDLQWLLGIYRSSALQRALDALGEPTEHGVEDLLGTLAITPVSVDPLLVGGVDTWSEARAWDRRLKETEANHAR